MFVPMMFGYAFRHFFPEPASKVRKVLGKTAFPALMILALTFFLQYPKEIAENFGVLGLSAALLIMLAGVVFHSGEMALPAIMYALLMNVILLTYVYIIRK
jgi:BASS family bile acid:Na+ symporter